MRTAVERALAREVLLHGPISRAALAERLDLSPASLTRLARPLLESGLLVELEPESGGTVGRPSRPLDVARDTGRFVGVTLTGEQHVHAVLTDVRAEALDAHQTTLAATTPDAVVDTVAAVVARLAPRRLAGLGVSLGATITDGVVDHAPFLGWDTVPLAALLRERLGVPVTVENDVVALAEAERWFGVGKETPGFAVVTIGSGIGFGLVVGGEVVRTPDDGVGTAGHLHISGSGPVCSEGHVGCAGALLTIAAITGQVSVALGRPVTYAQVLTLAAVGDPVAGAVVAAAGHALGILLTLVADLTLQSTIVLAGDGVALYPLVADQVAATVRALRNPRARPVEIHVRSEGFLPWTRGAAVAAIQTAIETGSLAPR